MQIVDCHEYNCKFNEAYVKHVETFKIVKSFTGKKLRD